MIHRYNKLWDHLDEKKEEVSLALSNTTNKISEIYSKVKKEPAQIDNIRTRDTVLEAINILRGEELSSKQSEELDNYEQQLLKEFDDLQNVEKLVNELNSWIEAVHDMDRASGSTYQRALDYFVELATNAIESIENHTKIYEQYAKIDKTDWIVHKKIIQLEIDTAERSMEAQKAPEENIAIAIQDGAAQGAIHEMRCLLFDIAKDTSKIARYAISRYDREHEFMGEEHNIARIAQSKFESI